jgi:hypothetical protein
MNVIPNRSALLIAASVLLAGIFGCPQPTVPEGLLEGRWEVVPDQGFDGSLTNLFVTFNANDQVSDVSYEFNDGVIVSWHDPGGSTSVDGATIHVTCTVAGNGFTFDGTLDSSTSPASADGSLTLEFELGDLGVSMPRGPATLVKQ